MFAKNKFFINVCENCAKNTFRICESCAKILLVSAKTARKSFIIAKILVFLIRNVREKNCIGLKCFAKMFLDF